MLVLIDTWWNVNYKTKVTTSKTASGFNRYMVECESISELKKVYEM